MDHYTARTAAKLRGHNCVLKFKDGEELYYTAPELDESTPALHDLWFSDAEHFINGTGDQYCLPVANIAINRHCIKYISRL